MNLLKTISSLKLIEISGYVMVRVLICTIVSSLKMITPLIWSTRSLIGAEQISPWY